MSTSSSSTLAAQLEQRIDDFAADMKRLIRAEPEAVSETPAPAKTRRRRNRGPRIDAATKQNRRRLLHRYKTFRAAKAMNEGWKRGNKEPWSNEAISEMIARVTGRETFDPRRLYEWLQGSVGLSEGSRLIEKTLHAETERMRRAGVVPHAFVIEE